MPMPGPNEIDIDDISEVLKPGQHQQIIATGRHYSWGSHVAVLYATWNDPDHKPSKEEAGLTILEVADLFETLAEGIRMSKKGRAELLSALLAELAESPDLLNDILNKMEG